ncbi:hypothetical protein GM418_00575 [Maribellus comscasis]|uniref:Heavy metal-binding domain-containing protein n=1 Tax=Maribellus comscasis TaxID=2681766 RepID=A0A6I6JMK6_9BACT|nr:hypothetical protein [Maribellus comscasis]QGY42200.1 hypothetical protein GM418_00575 [Maribellus comscasis]
MKTKTLVILIIGVMLASCSATHILTNDNTQRYLPNETKNIEVFSTSKIDREYVIIGDVVSRVEDFNGANASVKYLKKEAAKIGADGIINLRLSIERGYIGNGVEAKGTAVKYIN